MPKGIPLTENELAQRRRQIAAAAVALFVEKGFAETSMREIAAAAGVGKSSLYDFFAAKEDILIYYFENDFQRLTERARQICAAGLPADQTLRQVLQASLAHQLSQKELFFRLSIEAQRMGPHSQARLQHSRHAYQDLLCNLIETGIHEGSFRPVDSLLTMRMILAALTSAIYTTRPSGTPQEMLDAVLGILLDGIRSQNQAQNQTPTAQL